MIPAAFEWIVDAVALSGWLEEDVFVVVGIEPWLYMVGAPPLVETMDFVVRPALEVLASLPLVLDRAF